MPNFTGFNLTGREDNHVSHIIFSCSLSATSRSAILATRLHAIFRERGEPVGLFDLREIALPFCDAGACYAHPEVVRLTAAIQSAKTITIATPIHNFDVGGATRNLMAVAGKSWTGKTIGFLCGAGGMNSYMAVMGLAQSLMLDFRCLIVPRFVYADSSAFENDRLADADLARRIEQLCDELRRIGTALPAEQHAS